MQKCMVCLWTALGLREGIWEENKAVWGVKGSNPLGVKGNSRSSRGSRLEEGGGNRMRGCARDISDTHQEGGASTCGGWAPIIWHSFPLNEEPEQKYRRAIPEELRCYKWLPGTGDLFLGIVSGGNSKKVHESPVGRRGGGRLEA